MTVEGLAFFLATVLPSFLLVSREKVKSGPMATEKLMTWPWFDSAWQKSKHLMAKGELASSTAVILVYF